MQTNQRYIFGEWSDATTPLNVADVKALCSKANQVRRELSSYSQEKIYALLGRLSEIWKDLDHPRVRQLRETLPSETGFSIEMVDLGLKELAWMLDPNVLRQKVKTELSLNHYNPDTRTTLCIEPLGTVLHVLSGNVFLVGVGSFLEGVLTKNVTILKMSSGETRFLPAFLESLLEADTDGVVSRSIAVINYRSNEKEVINTLKSHVDGIVVWGGEEAVRAYREGLPARTRLIVFGPKLSIGVVTKSGAAEVTLDSVAARLADELAIWDQNACTAPQVCFVESEDLARHLAPLLGDALQKKSKTLPPGPVAPDTAVEIQKLRGLFEMFEARGEALSITSRANVDWSVFMDRNREIDPSPLHRTIRVIPFSHIEELQVACAPIRGYLQTVGMVASLSERQSYSAILANEGAVRIVDLGQMSGGEIDDPHDGAYDLPQLVNVVVKRNASEREDYDPFDYLSADARIDLINERILRLGQVARKSPFYGKRLDGFRLESTDDLKRFPMLTRDEMESNILPKGTGLSTVGEDFVGGYVTRSGGSTGEPKFSVYDGQDWEQMVSNAVRVFRAAGLQKKDRLANCMLAGDLYGSFVSFDHVNARVGAATFPFAGELNPEVFLAVWKRFRLNAIQAIPTVLVPLFRVAKQLDPDFTFEKVIYAGTPLSASDRDWIENSIGTKRISSVIGATDGGQIGFQCSHLKGAFHHTIDDFNYIEIVDDKGERLPDGESGRILITSLLKFAFPLIRYELGDAARIIPGPCECGRTNRVLEYLGRSDDTVCVALMNVSYRDFTTALKALPISAMQLAAKNNEEGEFIELRIETVFPTEETRQQIVNAICEAMPTLKKRLEDGSLSRLEIQLSVPGSLPRNARSGKIRNVVDERK